MRFRESAPSNKTTNLAGGVAYTQNPEIELVSLLLTSFVEDQFYRSADGQLDRLKQLITDIKDKEFISQAISYARNEFGLRSITHAATIELLPFLKDKPNAYLQVKNAIRRPDDILEMVAYWKKNHKGGLPSAMRRGINAAIAEFDEYRLTKYQGKNSSVKMVDVFNLTHPKPANAEREAIYKRLMTGELKNTETWESKLSKAGQDGETEEQVAELKGAAWKDLLEQNKLGYFALLRNLRNIIVQAPDCVDLACKALLNAEEIKKSLVFPFRFMTAIDAVDELVDTHFDAVNKIKFAIDGAIEISLNNVPRFDGTTLVVLDKSGSMCGKPSRIGSLFTAVMIKANPNAHLMFFATHAQYVQLDSRVPVWLLANIIGDSSVVYGGTNFHTIFLAAQQKYDRVVILSDMQGWMGDSVAPTRELNQYKAKHAADPFIYSFDLSAYGSMQFKSDKVFCIAGFSDKIFNIVKLMEQDRNALLNTIKGYKIV